jgi:hypothetical protein
MTRKAFAVFVSVVVGSLLVSSSARAADSDTCHVSITSPAPGARAGADVLITGKAAIAPGTSLWAFARRKGLGSVWPQAGGSILPDAQGEFSVLVILGTPGETGDFEVFLEVVDSTQNAKLETWFRQAEQTGRYPGMPVPPFVAGCGAPVKITVTKTA